MQRCGFKRMLFRVLYTLSQNMCLENSNFEHHKNEIQGMKTNQHIVVAGGGFAGVEAAIALRKKHYQVTLVSNRDFFFMYPTSIWIPLGKSTIEKTSMSLPRLAKKHGFALVLDEVVNVHGNQNQLELKTQTLHYNYLVLATGAGKMKHKGLEHTFSICGQPEGAVAIQKRFQELIQQGSGKIAVGFGGNPKDKSGVRGGPAFEILFNMINDLKKKHIRQNFDFTFFAPMPEPGKRMGKSGYGMLDTMLAKHHIDKKVGKKITAFNEGGIALEDDDYIESDLTLFIPALNGAPFLQDSDLPLNEAGFVKVDNTNKVLGFENMYAVGDVAAMEGPEWKAKQGHMAVVMGQNAAYNIHQQIQGSALRKGYQEHINILCVMDTGNAAAYVYRKGEKDYVIPMPVFGHWLKKAWGWHYKLTRYMGWV